MKRNNILIIRLLPLAFAFLLFSLTNVNAKVYTMNLLLEGINEVPGNPSPAKGTLIGTYDDVSNTLSFTLTFNGLVGLTTASHFHGPAGPGVNGPIIIPLAGFPVGVPAGSYSNAFVLTDDQEYQLLCGQWYINIHSSQYPGGEIRSQMMQQGTVGNITNISIALIGENEVPGNMLPGTGTLTGTYDHVTKVLNISLSFSNLAGTTTAAHIHGAGGPGVNAAVIIPLAGFPVGVTSGAYANAFVLTPEQESWLMDGLLYVNIHTTFLPGGEIRGQLSSGTLVGDCGNMEIPISNWALLLGVLFIVAYSIIMLRRRS